jgi:hypothetical protein
MDALREVLRVKHYATWIERVLARFGSLNPESALSLQPAPRPASVRSQICQHLSRGTESGRGLPQSKTLCEFGRMGARASVLECGCLLPLSFHWRAKGTSGEERLGSSRGDGLGAASYWRDTLPMPSIGSLLVLYWSSIGPLLVLY